jgi:hypothetical protein
VGGKKVLSRSMFNLREQMALAAGVGKASR